MNTGQKKTARSPVCALKCNPLGTLPSDSLDGQETNCHSNKATPSKADAADPLPLIISGRHKKQPSEKPRNSYDRLKCEGVAGHRNSLYDEAKHCDSFSIYESCASRTLVTTLRHRYLLQNVLHCYRLFLSSLFLRIRVSCRPI